MSIYGKTVNETKNERQKKYLRYPEAMELYGVGLTKVKKLAKEAGALYKIGGVVLINVEKLDSYIESFRV